MKRAHGVSALGVAVLLAACYGGPGTSLLTASPVGAPVRGIDAGFSVDPAMVPVSISAKEDGAAAALEACYITDTTGRFGSNGPLGVDRVSGMGLVISGDDVGRYVPLTGREPDLETKASVWVVALAGRVWLPFWPSDLNDPTCMLIDGNAVWYATGGRFEGDAIVSPDVAADGRQAFRLPPLSP